MAYSVIVFGANGFIGRAMVRKLIEQNVNVLGVGLNAPSERICDFVELKANSQIDEIISGKPDFVINCAGSASVPLSLENPLNDYLKNTDLVVQTLEAIRKNSPFTKFINLSSAAVYGQPEELPVKEESTPRPISPYGYNKWISEIICNEYRTIYKIQTCVVRIFSAYGPGLRKQLFWDLHDKYCSYNGNTIQLFGTGKESRDFIYITDLVNAIYLLLKKEIPHPVVNLASGSQTTIKEAADFFFAAYSFPDYTFSGQKKEGDPQKWQADISIIKSLGFLPEVSMHDGIGNYVKWLQNEKAAIRSGV